MQKNDHCNVVWTYVWDVIPMKSGADRENHGKVRKEGKHLVVNALLEGQVMCCFMNRLAQPMRENGAEDPSIEEDNLLAIGNCWWC